MSRKIFWSYGLTFLVSFVVLFFLHGFVMDYFFCISKISLLKTYGISFGFCVFLFSFLIYQTHRTKKINLVKFFLIFSLLKIFLFILFFREVLFAKTRLSNADKLVFMIPYFGGLFFEILWLKRPLEKKII